MNKLPVTVLSGFLGAGKTTLLNKELTSLDTVADRGMGMNDEATLRQKLDTCLLTDAEMKQGYRRWAGYRDPFPSWDGDIDA